MCVAGSANTLMMIGHMGNMNKDFIEDTVINMLKVQPKKKSALFHQGDVAKPHTKSIYVG